VEKYGTAGKNTNVNIIRRMRCACWITTTSDTHSEYVIFIVFHGKIFSILGFTHIAYFRFIITDNNDALPAINPQIGEALSLLDFHLERVDL
jgi:hypothetical protein